MVAYGSHASDYGALKLGRRIQQQREKLGFTLQELSRRSQISIGRLSQIENGHRVLDAVQAGIIAEALGVSLTSLLPNDESVPYVISRDRGGKAPAVAPDDPAPLDGERRWPLASLFVGRHLEPFFTQVQSTAAQFSYHHEYEFVFVLKGTIALEVKTADALETEQLGRGDCVYFRSSLPHRLRAMGREPAECLQIIAPGVRALSAGAPVTFPAATDDEGENDHARMIGRELSALRLSRDWTIERVAGMAGISVRQMQQLEAGTRRPPLDVMIRLARAFGRPLRDLVKDPRSSGPAYFIQRSADIAKLTPRHRRAPTDRRDAPTPNAFYPLASAFPAQQMYPYLIRVRNVDVEMLTPHEHHGEEFMYVLDGQLEVTTVSGEQPVTEVLHAGDSCYLDASVPHFIRGLTRSPYTPTSAEVLDVFWCSLGEKYLFAP